MIMTDDQRAGTIEAMPEVKRLFIDEGMNFPSAFATTPACCPSRASIYTGLYAHNHGVVDNGSAHALEPAQMVLRRLQAAGYTTAFAGKFLNQWDVHERPPHFDYFAVIEDEYPDIYFDYRVNLNGTVTRMSDRYSTDYMADSAAEFLARTEHDDGKPWALILAPFAPHLPATPAREYEDAEVPAWETNPAVRERDRFDKPPFVRYRSIPGERIEDLRARQLRSLMSVDDLVGDLFDRLESQEESNTLAFFLSDNGYMWGEHGLSSKRWPYLYSTLIPLAMRWPGRVQAGAVDGRLAANIDIAATIAGAAGLEGSRPMDGSSLLEPSDRRRLLLEYSFYSSGPPGWASTITKEYQYIEYYYGNGAVRFREYYDLAGDPHQLENLLRGHDRVPAGRLARIQRTLESDIKCRGSACP